jgi:phage-related protein
MASEISDWISLAALITSFMAYLEAKKTTKTADAVQALQEIIIVSEKTETYLQKRANGIDRDRSSEYELAELWSRAAFRISRFDNNLSVRLCDKSEFWRNPDTWSVGPKAHKNISLASVTAEAKRLMESYA